VSNTLKYIALEFILCVLGQLDIYYVLDKKGAKRACFLLPVCSSVGKMTFGVSIGLG
jgi:hypothetical protein